MKKKRLKQLATEAIGLIVFSMTWAGILIAFLEK